MYDIEHSLEQQIAETSPVRPTVIFTEPTELRVLEALCSLGRFVRPVLLASEKAVRRVVEANAEKFNATQLDFTLTECAFLEPEDHPELLEEFAREYVDFYGKQQDVTYEEAYKLVTEPGLFGIMATRLGHADMVVGGVVYRPRDFYRPMADLLCRHDFCTEACVFVLPDSHPMGDYPENIVVLGDVGINNVVTPEILARIAVGTSVIARDIIPEKLIETIRGVFVSYAHKDYLDDEPFPALVTKAADLVEPLLDKRRKLHIRYNSVVIKGALRARVSLSACSAVYHRPEGEAWEGAPTVIVCPNLEMGNMLYQFYASSYPDAKHFTVMYGTGNRGVSLSRDCTSEDIRLTVKATVLRLLKFNEYTPTTKETFFAHPLVLAINPGSTSTKFSVYRGDEELFSKELFHGPQDLAPFEGHPICDQFNYRTNMIIEALEEHGLKGSDISAIAARGGLLAPMPHGTYEIGDIMMQELRAAKWGDHACNLGAIIGQALADEWGIKAYIVDPGVVDEMRTRARLTGVKDLPRRTVWHALNQLAIARRYATEHETFYEKLNLIVCHMGGGVSFAAHHHGVICDTNNALEGEGPFSPERSGTLPVGPLIDLCFSGKYTHAEVKRLNRGKGGMINLLGTSDFKEIERRAMEGEKEYADVFDAFAYQVAKAITSMVPAFEGEPVDQILLTGGMARSKALIKKISKYVAALGVGVSVYPGENEMKALVKGVLRVLAGREVPKTYPAK